jgi:hypothetical protein
VKHRYNCFGGGEASHEQFNSPDSETIEYSFAAAGGPPFLGDMTATSYKMTGTDDETRHQNRPGRIRVSLHDLNVKLRSARKIQRWWRSTLSRAEPSSRTFTPMTPMVSRPSPPPTSFGVSDASNRRSGSIEKRRSPPQGRKKDWSKVCQGKFFYAEISMYEHLIR